MEDPIDPDIGSLNALIDRCHNIKITENELDQLGGLFSWLHSKNLARKAIELLFSKQYLSIGKKIEILDMIIENVQGAYLGLVSENLH